MLPINLMAGITHIRDPQNVSTWDPFGLTKRTELVTSPCVVLRALSNRLDLTVEVDGRNH